MSSSLPLQIAETIQTASINRHPSPDHDLNPSTTASQKQPVSISDPDPEPPASESSLDKYAYDDEESIDEEDDDDDDIPYSVLEPVPRRLSFGPLPDLRFEQSYLASIAGAETNWRVAYITMRDQVRPSCIKCQICLVSDGEHRFCCRLYKAQSGVSRSTAGDSGTAARS